MLVPVWYFCCFGILAAIDVMNATRKEDLSTLLAAIRR